MSLAITSFSFFCFLALVVLVYYIIPKNRWIVLWLASGFYYVYITKGNILPILISTVSLWLGSMLVAKNNLKIKQNITESKALKKKCKLFNRRIISIIVAINVGLLLYYKFYSDTGLPLAISFYTLSGIAYIVDVYKGEDSENNICKVSLLLCFFPLVTQGPVVRHKKIKNTLYRDNQFDIDNIIWGIIVILWGGVKKLVIADRLYPFVDGVFNDYTTYSGIIIPIAVAGYMIQLYCDFSGGIDVIMGCAQLFGISLPINFRQPYFSASVSEFWRRWHISLGNWFKDYVYMPLAMSKCNNKLYSILKLKFGITPAKLITTSAITFIVWIMNGVWHGAGWNYAVFGAYMGVLIVIDNLKKNTSKGRWVNNTIVHSIQVFRTLLFVAIGWMLIRINSLEDFPLMIMAMFNKSQQDIVTTMHVFLNDMDWVILIYGICLLFIVDFFQQKSDIRERLSNIRPILKVSIGVIIIFTWFVLAYDSGNEVRGFIYAKF